MPFKVGPSLLRSSSGKIRLLSLLINVALVLEVASDFNSVQIYTKNLLFSAGNF